MSANVLFVLSKEEGQPRRGSAVVGLILGVMSTIFGVVEFFCLIQVYHMITDPQYAPFFDQAMELYERLVRYNKMIGKGTFFCVFLALKSTPRHE